MSKAHTTEPLGPAAWALASRPWPRPHEPQHRLSSCGCNPRQTNSYGWRKDYPAAWLGCAARPVLHSASAQGPPPQGRRS